MRKHSILQGVILLSLLTGASYANSDGFYVGAEANLILLGDDSFTLTNKDATTRTYNRVEGSHANIKIGYQHFKNNRVELYYRYNNFDTNVGDIVTKTFGINYEWAFSSLSTKKLTPYALIGIGGGEAKSSSIKALDNAEVGEANFGVGIHYCLNEHIDFQAGYARIYTGFDAFDNQTTDKTSAIAQDNFIVGASYKF